MAQVLSKLRQQVAGFDPQVVRQVLMSAQQALARAAGVITTAGEILQGAGRLGTTADEWAEAVKEILGRRFDRDASGLLDMADERSFLRYNMLMNVARIAVVFASIPWWQWLGLL